VKVLVTGATGLIGCHAAARLAAAGHEVRALVRDPAKLARVLAPFPGAAARVEACAGDATDAQSVRAALAGCDGALHCAGVFSHDLADAERLRQVNVEGTRCVLGAAAEAGLDPIVHVSSMLAMFPPAGERLRADDPVTRPRGMYAATKADAERIARGLQDGGARVAIVYPSSTHGPHDPTLGSGPELIANTLRSGRVLVTQGGLAYTDVRDLAALLAALFAPGERPRRIMAPSAFLPHARYHALLCELTGRALEALRIPGALLRAMGRAGDLRQRLLGRSVQLTSEAAAVLTRSVPVDDAPARERLGAEPIPLEDSFRDLLVWMHQAGVLSARCVGRLAGEPAGAPPRAARAAPSAG
jgi:nucleoside-diphosphate-sugar epimerase